MLIDTHAHMYKYPYPISYDKNNDKFELLFPNGEELIKLQNESNFTKILYLNEKFKMMPVGVLKRL